MVKELKDIWTKYLKRHKKITEFSLEELEDLESGVEDRIELAEEEGQVRYVDELESLLYKVREQIKSLK